MTGLAPKNCIDEGVIQVIGMVSKASLLRTATTYRERSVGRVEVVEIIGESQPQIGVAIGVG